MADVEQKPAPARDTPDFVKVFYAHLHDADHPRAERALARLSGTIPDHQWRFLSAELAAAQADHDRVQALLEPLFGHPQHKFRAINLVAHALLEAAQPDAARAVLAQTGTGPLAARLRISTEIMARDFDAAAREADAAMAEHPEKPVVHRRALYAYQRAGRHEDVAAILGRLSGADRIEGLRNVFEAGTSHGELALPQAFGREFFTHRHSFITTAMQQLYDPRQVATPGILADRENFKANLRKLLDMVDQPETALRLARAFGPYGENDEAEHYAERYREMRRRMPLDPHEERRWTREIPAHQLDAVAQWLGVEAPLEDWKRRVLQMHGLPNFLTELSAFTVDEMEELSRGMNLNPLTPDVYDLQRRGKGCFFVTTHLGWMMGMWPAMPDALEKGVRIRVFGLLDFLRGLLPLGERLIPRNRDYRTRVRLARQMIEVIRQGDVVYISSDHLPGARTLIHQNGCSIRLPDSVPRVSHRFGAPSFFICAYFENDRLTSCCWPLPVPEPGEPVDAFTRRWSLAFLECQRRVCLADPRNIAPFGNLRFTAPGEAETL